MLIPLPLLGFLPQSPTFLFPYPPLGYDAALPIPRMLHRTVRNKSCTGNPGNNPKRTFPPREGRVWKRERERKPLGEERISSLLRSLPS